MVPPDVENFSDRAVLDMGLSFVRWADGGRDVFAPGSQAIEHVHNYHGVSHQWRTPKNWPPAPPTAVYATEREGIRHSHPISFYMREHNFSEDR